MSCRFYARHVRFVVFWRLGVRGVGFEATASGVGVEGLGFRGGVLGQGLRGDLVTSRVQVVGAMPGFR